MRLLKIVLNVAVIWAVATIAVAAQNKFEEGKQFKRVALSTLQQPVLQQLKDKDKGKIQVVEFFNYGCHWCDRMEPFLNDWRLQKSDEVAFRRLPVALSKGWVTYAKTYYVIAALGQDESMHTKIFNAIHRQNKDLNSASNMEDFFVKNGVSKEQFAETFDSFATNRNLKFAELAFRAYGIRTVPTIVVNGPSGSYITSSSMAGSEKKVFDVVDYLIQREQKIIDNNG